MRRLTTMAVCDQTHILVVGRVTYLLRGGR